MLYFVWLVFRTFRGFIKLELNNRTDIIVFVVFDLYSRRNWS